MKTQRCTRHFPRFAALAVGALSVSLSSTAYGANIVVNTLADGSVAGACTLRDAVTAANTDAAVNACAAGSGADTITFNLSGTITLGSTLPAIVSPITVNGGNSITITAGNTVQEMVLVNIGATLQLQNLTMSNSPNWAIGNMGTLTIDNSTISGNGETQGSAINNQGTLTVSASTFANNTATTSDTGGVGAAIYNNGTVSISNSTFSNNRADDLGGAVFNGQQATIVNSTFSNNAAAQGGGIANYPGATLNLGNTILANNSGADCFNNGGTINASGVNLVGDGSCSIAGALSGNAMLAPLANNGGPTMTMALLPGSPAIDTADDNICAAAPVNNLDQRGEPRSIDGKCDIGAFEFGPDFQMAAIPSSGVVLRNVIGGFLLQLKSENGFNGPVTLSCSGGPAGSKCVDLPQTLNVNGTAYAASGILFDKDTPPGTYNVSYTGVSGSLSYSISVSFTLK